MASNNGMRWLVPRGCLGATRSIVVGIVMVVMGGMSSLRICRSPRCHPTCAAALMWIKCCEGVASNHARRQLSLWISPGLPLLLVVTSCVRETVARPASVWLGLATIGRFCCDLQPDWFRPVEPPVVR
jgi:hypothetical protein